MADLSFFHPQFLFTLLAVPSPVGSSFPVVVQSLSRVRLSVALWTAVHQASLPLTISRNLPKFVSIASVMPS